MKDSMKTCQHSLSDDIVYKEVVIIGNGPSGMVTSFMLAGNVPYLKQVPEDLPIDEMLRARLSHLQPGKNLYETDLIELAEGLEGRSQNPIPLLMDNLLRPCADLGIQADSLIEWKFDIEKQIDHIVLGRGPPGGAWHTFPPSVRTLSPGAWLALPPHAAAGAGRLSARAVAKYCRRYVHACGLQRYFRNNVLVTRVSVFRPSGPPCASACPLNAAFSVYGYDASCGRAFRYVCRRVVLAAGAGDRPNTLEPRLAPHASHALHHIERALHVLANYTGAPPGVLVVGSGVSAADAVCLARRARLRLHHAHRARADALARLAPQAYPDYCQVYKMMCDGPAGNHPNYTSHPEHIIVDITPIDNQNTQEYEDSALRLKRVTLLNLVTNETTTITVNLIAVLIGSKPDLFFLQTNFNLDCIDIKCLKCTEETKHAAKRKIEDTQRQCFLKNHWYYLKSVLGQSIQSCKSRYLNYTEINGNSDTKCIVPDCNKREKENTVENGMKEDKDWSCEIIPYSEIENKIKCTCQQNPYSSGIGFGIDPKKPVDGRSNPIAIDKSTHELLNGPKGLYALGPLTADNFVRFIPGGALAIVASIHKESKSE
ncbi:oxidative stress-induced growth inhibitor 1-like [Pectinophora gossypiella]|nr:oxidative stress-induced growth inhibitor 1-like [Pectinophora gossypiella]XP_049879956.1 oxidative stress-induced growth inhibitor 1-like [Pectinophora gossypiella]